MTVRPCIIEGCNTLTSFTRCPDHERHYQAARNQARPWYSNPEYRAARRLAAASLPLRCHLCQQPITHTGDDPTALTLDHIEAAHRTGGRGPWLPAHRSCNSRKGATHDKD